VDEGGENRRGYGVFYFQQGVVWFTTATVGIEFTDISVPRVAQGPYTVHVSMAGHKPLGE
jgi:hypothetical protein